MYINSFSGEIETKERERNSEEILTSSSTQVSQITANPVPSTTAAHTSSLTSLLPVTVKQEPIFQCKPITEPNLVKSPLPAPQSTTPVQTVLAACQTGRFQSLNCSLEVAICSSTEL